MRALRFHQWLNILGLLVALTYCHLSEMEITVCSTLLLLFLFSYKNSDQTSLFP